MSGQSATWLRQYAMFQVNFIFSVFLFTELCKLYELTVRHKNLKKKTDFTDT